MEKKKIGWIGLGNIGLPMAKQLVKHGYKVTVCGHTRRQPVKEMKSLGASEVKTIREVAEASDIVFSMVRDVPQTGEVLLGEQGLWEGMRADQILVLSSTLLPSFCEEVEREGKGKGVTVLDAPVSGGPWGAEVLGREGLPGEPNGGAGADIDTESRTKSSGLPDPPTTGRRSWGLKTVLGPMKAPSKPSDWLAAMAKMWISGPSVLA